MPMGNRGGGARRTWARSLWDEPVTVLLSDSQASATPTQGRGGRRGGMGSRALNFVRHLATHGRVGEGRKGCRCVRSCVGRLCGGARPDWGRVSPRARASSRGAGAGPALATSPPRHAPRPGHGGPGAGRGRPRADSPGRALHPLRSRAEPASDWTGRLSPGWGDAATKAAVPPEAPWPCPARCQASPPGHAFPSLTRYLAWQKV